MAVKIWKPDTGIFENKLRKHQIGKLKEIKRSSV